MVDNIQPFTQDEFEKEIKDFQEITANVAKGFLEEDEANWYLLVVHCPFCRKYYRTQSKP